MDWDVAQLVERRTVTQLTQVRFPGTWPDFLPTISFQCGLSCGVRTPSCAIACFIICAHVKDPIVHVRVRWIMTTHAHTQHVPSRQNNQLNDCCHSPERRRRSRRKALSGTSHFQTVLISRVDWELCLKRQHL